MNSVKSVFKAFSPKIEEVYHTLMERIEEGKLTLAFPFAYTMDEMENAFPLFMAKNPKIEDMFMDILIDGNHLDSLQELSQQYIAVRLAEFPEDTDPCGGSTPMEFAIDYLKTNVAIAVLQANLGIEDIDFNFMIKVMEQGAEANKRVMEAIDVKLSEILVDYLGRLINDYPLHEIVAEGLNPFEFIQLVKDTATKNKDSKIAKLVRKYAVGIMDLKSGETRLQEVIHEMITYRIERYGMNIEQAFEYSIVTTATMVDVFMDSLFYGYYIYLMEGKQPEEISFADVTTAVVEHNSITV